MITAIINDVRLTLVRLHIANADQITGCTMQEIEEIRLSQQVAMLPAIYQQFLQVMGKGTGSFLSESNIFYPDNLDLKSYTHRFILQDQDKLPENAFVFSLYNEQFMYFLIDSHTDDPAIHAFDGERFIWKSYHRFSDFLFESINAVSRFV